MSPLSDAPLVEGLDRAGWRAWLERHHTAPTGAWLVMRRRPSPPDDLDYEAAVEEALCFGWVDSTGGKVDEAHTKLYFAPRKPNSGWAATNKARIERLIASGRMAAPGLAAIDRAKANGSWTLLDSVERLEVPADLEAALLPHPTARTNFQGWPPSARKYALTQLVQARRPETRAARIRKLVEVAERGERPV